MLAKVMLLQVSVCPQGGACSGGGCLLRGYLLPGVMPGLRGGCLVPGVPGGEPPGRLLLWAVRILLECILLLSVLVTNTRNQKTIIQS